MIDGCVGHVRRGGRARHASSPSAGSPSCRPQAVARAAAAGHEIGSHSYDHEQLDALPVDGADARRWTAGLAALGGLGFDVRGFGAPRNSITDESRDRLMDWNLEYDGSAAYDPLTSLLDVRLRGALRRGADDRDPRGALRDPERLGRALGGRRCRPPRCSTAWTRRLDVVVASGEPVFVLDVHQWAISDPREPRGAARVHPLREGVRRVPRRDPARGGAQRPRGARPLRAARARRAASRRSARAGGRLRSGAGRDPRPARRSTPLFALASSAGLGVRLGRARGPRLRRPGHRSRARRPGAGLRDLDRPRRVAAAAPGGAAEDRP